MFKKFLNSLLGNKEEDNNSQSQPAAQNHYQAPQQEEEDDDDDSYQDSYDADDSSNYDPETLHGSHYTEEQFEAEVAKRAEAWIAGERAEGNDMQQKDIDNVYYNYRRDVYQEWNRCSIDQVMRWQTANSMKYMGFATSGFTKEDPNNPLLQPVHGINLRTYTAMAKKIAAGVDYKLVCKAMNLEPAIWEELNTVWPQRMAADTSFTVTALYGQYFGENLDDVTQLAGLEPEMSDTTRNNLDRMRNDPYFYEELEGARQAAYSYGLDGAQWILDNFGINLAQFQEVAMKHMEANNKNFNTEEILRRSDYRNEMVEKYAAVFAKEQGGNIADDVQF